MPTTFAISPDGVRIAYEVTGAGPSVMLLHGGGQNRQSWVEAGYVERLKERFKVITMDIRGNGESDKPTDPAYYTTDKLCEDILAVADSCNTEQFAICGFSYGGNIGRYLAAQSDRIEKITIMGIPFGLGASGDFRQFIEDFCNHWRPIIQAQSEGTLDIASLSTEDQEIILSGANLRLDVAWLGAILDWRAIEPADLGCPTLWLMGSENETAIASVKEYEEKLKTSKVQVEVLDGLGHMEEFTEINRSLPAILSFL
jgi:pimeloyl-ACP methyl ester carboxylesterase